MSKDLDSKAESAPPSGEPEKKPKSKRATSKANLIPVRVLETHGQSTLVEYEKDGMPYRSYVDSADIEDDVCPPERLQDAPYGIVWEFDFTDLARETELMLKRGGIWTYDDLNQHDRKLVRICTNLLGQRIWKAAKRGRNRRQK